MTTTDDPNVVIDPVTGEQTVLEPGDEGYVEPSIDPMAPAPHAEGEALAPTLPVQYEGEAGTPPQDLTLKSAEGQDASEAIVMNRGVVVESMNPADIVPNTPQIRPFPEEGVVEEEEEIIDGGEEEIVDDGGEEPLSANSSAADLIAAAQAATTTQELDEIESYANGRVTVLDAVATRRDELAQEATP